ncbi:hypothetical protein ACJ41O_013591 [Fusarium nematophilum]
MDGRPCPPNLGAPEPDLPEPPEPATSGAVTTARDLNARPRDAALDGTWGQPARVSEPSSAATKSFNLSRLAPLFLMHTLFSSVQRRHNHPNPSQDVSGESHRLYHHARSPSRPNLEAPNLPSSVLSPQVHDRSPPSVVPVPSSASPPGARDLPASQQIARLVVAVVSTSTVRPPSSSSAPQVQP